METLQRLHNRGSVSTGYDIDNSVKTEADNSEWMQRATGGGNDSNVKHYISNNVDLDTAASCTRKDVRSSPLCICKRGSRSYASKLRRLGRLEHIHTWYFEKGGKKS